ncbi:hypothetical protein Acr_24g0009870 [Actinidia rufa]|uniref:Uncharacterized protein n=1 Tax=Actinidia rufa TaxID=165716 RepID=A0A7J0GVC0_9ERIC|nr:hypothetical protein Acr_24g0009870 [Actinidia rufa]
MKNPGVDQLPEAHSLPDGFVDSSTEQLAPSTPTPEQEKPLSDHKEEKISRTRCSRVGIASRGMLQEE